MINGDGKSYQMEFNSKFRRVTTTKSSLPQIAIKRKGSDSPSSSRTEVVLLNGNWDTSYKIPKIIAEMHNVNIDELEAIRCVNSCSGTGIGGKQMKIDTDLMGAPSPLGSDSGIEGDCSDGNLSWLLNYKINELPPVPDSSTVDQANQNGSSANLVMTNSTSPQNHGFRIAERNFSGSNGFQKPYHSMQPKFIQLAPSNNEQDNKMQTTHTYRYSGPKKPPFTYTELIEHALVEKGELTVSGIYQWISDHFPFYKQNDDRWKNSVRHNLSINPHFRKGSKAVHGAGHLWTIAQKEDQKTWNIKKQRMLQFIETTMSDYNRQKQQEMELATATASILPPDNQNHCISQNGPSNVEVEYVIDMSGGLGDFLCPPVSKEQVAEECGLGGDYLITDLNPTSLGLNLSDAEIINGANLYDDLNFQCYELQTD